MIMMTSFPVQMLGIRYQGDSVKTKSTAEGLIRRKQKLQSKFSTPAMKMFIHTNKVQCKMCTHNDLQQ